VSTSTPSTPTTTTAFENLQTAVTNAAKAAIEMLTKGYNLVADLLSTGFSALTTVCNHAATTADRIAATGTLVCWTLVVAGALYMCVCLVMKLGKVRCGGGEGT
jgi:hypothetical protein